MATLSTITMQDAMIGIAADSSNRVKGQQLNLIWIGRMNDLESEVSSLRQKSDNLVEDNHTKDLKIMSLTAEKTGLEKLLATERDAGKTKAFFSGTSILIGSLALEAFRSGMVAFGVVLLGCCVIIALWPWRHLISTGTK